MTDSSPIVLISGSRKGIGRALAEHYLARNWMVVGCSRGAASIAHDNYAHYEVDITDETRVIAFLRDALREHGTPYALLNNAGIAAMNALTLTPGKTAWGVMSTNILGTFYLIRETAKGMIRQRGGRIVNFTSIARPLALEGEAVYAASKAAVESLTQSAAREFGSHGITVNAVGPCPVRTDLLNGVSEKALGSLQKRQTIQRLAEFSDIANVTDFFLRPESSMITGQTLYLGGAYA